MESDDQAARVVSEQQQDAIEAHTTSFVMHWTHESDPRPDDEVIRDLALPWITRGRGAVLVRATCAFCGLVRGENVCVPDERGIVKFAVTIAEEQCGCGSTTVNMTGYPACDLCLSALDKCACDDGTGRHPTNPPEITER